MNKEIIFLEPVLKSLLWGSELWAISAHADGDCRISSGAFRGETLSWLWNNHRELFGFLEGEVFPLLVKIIDAKEDLSIQVHPDDNYAREHEGGALGKSECWYILDCPQEASLIIGHNARSRNELKQMINENRWEELIRRRAIMKGDFLQIDPGTVHAITAGTMLLETQQSSNLTYRLYDYGRMEKGIPRQLHLSQSIDVIRCPHEEPVIKGLITIGEEYQLEELISTKYYTVCKLKLNGRHDFLQDKRFLNASVIAGSGSLDGIELIKGSHFIIPANYGTYNLEGDMELIISFVC